MSSTRHIFGAPFIWLCFSPRMQSRPSLIWPAIQFVRLLPADVNIPPPAQLGARVQVSADVISLRETRRHR